MSYPLFHLVHLIFVILFVGIAVVPFVSPLPETKRTTIMLSGIFGLIAFLSGFGLLGILKLGVPAWAIVKVVCWLIISALPGLVYRCPQKKNILMVIGLITLITALVMVGLKPF
jgi:hypothetical protein